MRRAWLALACTVLIAIPAGAQPSGQMTTGVSAPEPAPRSAGGLETLSQAERLELLRIAEAERRRSKRGLSVDCGPERAARPMTDLERASWKLKCGK